MIPCGLFVSPIRLPFPALPEALEKVFHACQEQVADSLGRQDIQAARITIERLSIKIELNYDEVSIRYRYPLGAGLGRRIEQEMLEAEPIERSLHDMDWKSIQSIYKLAPPGRKPQPPRKPRPVNHRDMEIFRLHTVEKKTIRELANKYDISMKRVWGICTRIRKCGLKESGEEIGSFSEYLTLKETTCYIPRGHINYIIAFQ